MFMKRNAIMPLATLDRGQAPSEYLLFSIPSVMLWLISGKPDHLIFKLSVHPLQSTLKAKLGGESLCI